ncbi:MAG TPA: hypothetical protein VGS79_06215 [Puia sp.]|nr:hypothetical protein [Puia sp.]
MKKFKWSILSLAVILSLCGAFVTRPHFDCSTMTQYYYQGGTYFPAGEEGVSYICTSGSNTCTYYTTNGVNFFQCQAGVYCTSNCFVREKDNPAKSSKPATTPVNPQ